MFLINFLFTSGLFANHLKTAKVISLRKKDDTRDVHNYRAISLLPSLSKVFEKAVHIQLTELLERNNILDPNQHGFWSGRLVVSAAVVFIDKIVHQIS